jgi:hypothetical protein
MKMGLMTIILAGLLLSFTGDLQAQTYDPNYYAAYWDGAQYQLSPQQYDPYYELHVLHYQLYLPQHQPYQVYPPCCVPGDVVIPGWSGPIAPLPPVIINPRPRTMRRR